MPRSSYLLTLAAVVVFPAACTRNPSQRGAESATAAPQGKPERADRTSELLRARLAARPAAGAGDAKSSDTWAAVRRLYESNGYQPVWVASGRPRREIGDPARRRAGRGRRRARSGRLRHGGRGHPPRLPGRRALHEARRGGADGGCGRPSHACLREVRHAPRARTRPAGAGRTSIGSARSVTETWRIPSRRRSTRESSVTRSTASSPGTLSMPRSSRSSPAIARCRRVAAGPPSPRGWRSVRASPIRRWPLSALASSRPAISPAARRPTRRRRAGLRRRDPGGAEAVRAPPRPGRGRPPRPRRYSPP